MIAANFTDNDSIAVENKPISSNKPTKTIKKSGILMVNRFDAFIDSINSTIPDTVPFYDWITNDIHIRKFDFSKVEDTLMVILNDSNDFYTPPVKGPITSEFGKRGWRYHYGTDIDLHTGDTVRVAFSGRVRISTYSKTYGNVIVVRHNNGLETIYGHLSKRLVKIDSTISSGTVIGLGGNTGHSFGSHLHFEIRYFDEALDPRDVIAFESFKLHYDTLPFRNAILCTVTN
jgi:murein DD-endopeptidase MepM/ murein hydrolase activator NlpD